MKNDKINLVMVVSLFFSIFVYFLSLPMQYKGIYSNIFLFVFIVLSIHKYFLSYSKIKSEKIRYDVLLIAGAINILFLSIVLYGFLNETLIIPSRFGGFTLIKAKDTYLFNSVLFSITSFSIMCSIMYGAILIKKFKK
jgi:hypothetical protein